MLVECYNSATVRGPWPGPLFRRFLTPDAWGQCVPCWYGVGGGQEGGDMDRAPCCVRGKKIIGYKGKMFFCVVSNLFGARRALAPLHVNGSGVSYMGL